MTKIPKIIHYCWFGRSPKNELIEKCIKSWEVYCPDYQIIEWNEDNSEYKSCDFVQEAYKLKKWAFVSDYVRLVVLYKYGGVYLDTDVELIDNIDELLFNSAFVGYAEDMFIGTATIASEKGNLWCKMLIEHYDKMNFIDAHGKINMTPNNEIITDITLKNCGFKIGESHIELGDVVVYPSEFFSPFKKWIMGNNEKKYAKKNYALTNDTKCIHHTDLSWQTEKDFPLRQRLFRQFLRLIFSSKIYWRLKRKAELQRLGWNDFTID